MNQCYYLSVAILLCTHNLFAASSSSSASAAPAAAGTPMLSSGKSAAAAAAAAAEKLAIQEALQAAAEAAAYAKAQALQDLKPTQSLKPNESNGLATKHVVVEYNPNGENIDRSTIILSNSCPPKDAINAIRNHIPGFLDEKFSVFKSKITGTLFIVRDKHLSLFKAKK